jgi:hypothetical protein
MKGGLHLGTLILGFAVAGLACGAAARPSTDDLREIEALAAAEFAKEPVGSLLA